MQSSKAFTKRDSLVSIEKKVQSEWNLTKPFEVNAPEPGENVPPKYMVSFPYPYMNGRLHLGHSFSLSKVEFTVGYQRMKGKRVLFPFGFHCTGMPIKACADKLKREIEIFGSDFSNYVEDTVHEDAVEVTESNEVDPTKIVKKHGKLNAKSTGLKYQFQIMRALGVPNEEIKEFADSKYWLYYFPPLAVQDLKDFGLSVDWRRSFITTDVNPYYDSFIRWQFNQLKSCTPPKVQFGERYTIYSPLDGQPCMDHDRASGEGVGVQEYTGIKLKVLLDKIDPKYKVKDQSVGSKLLSLKGALGNRSLYLVAATLRPETMFGQTNCFVGVDLDYGIFVVNEKEAWVCTERAARNMSFQNLFEEKGKVSKVGDLKGWDLVGVPLRAPLSKYDVVYTLPMEGVIATKGTGVVTSVPSDAPDDYVTLMDLSKKPTYYHVNKDWVDPFLPPISIIDTPNYGGLAAVKVVQDLKIASQKDKVNLAKAKEIVYKEGYYSGKMIVGPHAGK